ncbi:no significant blast hit [Histoplasma capsulatum]|uniref:No significant blast hit n=1 Tax=Ajellomyces capsulatus TaxID=5037 RepID=A0A8A1MF19_AJECA|nr:no significant blast hit [Histoplasma capsulatum]
MFVSPSESSIKMLPPNVSCTESPRLSSGSFQPIPLGIPIFSIILYTDWSGNQKYKTGDQPGISYFPPSKDEVDRSKSMLRDDDDLAIARKEFDIFSYAWWGNNLNNCGSLGNNDASYRLTNVTVSPQNTPFLPHNVDKVELVSFFVVIGTFSRGPSNVRRLAVYKDGGIAWPTVIKYPAYNLKGLKDPSEGLRKHSRNLQNPFQYGDAVRTHSLKQSLLRKGGN